MNKNQVIIDALNRNRGDNNTQVLATYCGVSIPTIMGIYKGDNIGIKTIRGIAEFFEKQGDANARLTLAGYVLDEVGLGDCLRPK